MKIAVEGCAHGELEAIYDTIKLLEEKEEIKVDLLICCGDFQSTRNEGDLRCMAVPDKYSKMCSFYKYYNGEKVAPILTIFIGGNHEASNYLQELPYGGWVAPNIYYMGYAGVINIAGVRIGGLSGIFKGVDYMKGHFEKPPYNDGTKRSVYHIRNFDIFRLKQLSSKIDIFLSHDWPTGITEYGDQAQLIRFKPFFQEDIASGKLGSRPCEELLNLLQPKYWFSAHLHCKFAALVKHDDEKSTRFLALDKCLPKRRFLQILDIPHNDNEKIEISYDLEWLTILYLTEHLMSAKKCSNYMPGPGKERWEFTPTEEEKNNTFLKFEKDLKVPLNFQKTVDGFDPLKPKKNVQQPLPKSNPQTVLLCKKLGIKDPMTLITELDTSYVPLDEEQNVTLNISQEENSILEHSTPSRKLKSLSLPEPKADSSLESIEVSNLSILSKGSSDEPKTDTSFDVLEEKDELNLSQESQNLSQESQNLSQDSQSDNKVQENSDTPVKKKFKRRNANIYDS